MSCRTGTTPFDGATGDIVITSGAFTQDARGFARGKPLVLLDGKALMDLVAEVQKKTLETSSKA